jgi:hypothetical protein
MDALSDPPPRRDIPDLELALLYRGITERRSNRQACERCGRSPLVGERVYPLEGRRLLCALCSSRGGDPPPRWTLVRGPEFGHTLRLLGRRAA